MVSKVRTLWVVWVVGMAAVGLSGQTSPVASSPCPEGETTVGDLGFRHISCDCTARFKDNWTTWTFREEPQLEGIVPGGPADGKLEEGDRIVAVDGGLITTHQGGARFSNVAPGDVVRLTVRRDGRVRDVLIVAGSVCGGEALGGLTPMHHAEHTLHAAPAPAPEMSWQMLATSLVLVDSARQRAPRAPRTPRPAAPEAPPSAATEAVPPASAAPPGRTPRPAPIAPRAPELASRGWFGMGLNCNECGLFRASPRAAPRWVFNDLPQIYYVDPGSPAEKAGLRRDDVLTQIGGVSLLTEEAGRKFGAVRPGQAVRWTYRRGGDTRSVVVVAKRRPDSEEVIPLPDLKDELRLLKEELSVQERNRSLDELAARIERMSLPKVPKDLRQRLRYSGVVGASEVEVRGLGTVVVTTDEATGELLITTSDATVRVRSAEKPRTPRER